MNRHLRTFEHGNTFVTLDSENGEYSAKLYIRATAKNDHELVNEFKSTTLDAVREVYHQTCQEALRRE